MTERTDPSGCFQLLGLLVTFFAGRTRVFGLSTTLQLLCDPGAAPARRPSQPFHACCALTLACAQFSMYYVSRQCLPSLPVAPVATLVNCLLAQLWSQRMRKVHASTCSYVMMHSLLCWVARTRYRVTGMPYKCCSPQGCCVATEQLRSGAKVPCPRLPHVSQSMQV